MRKKYIKSYILSLIDIISSIDGAYDINPNVRCIPDQKPVIASVVEHGYSRRHGTNTYAGQQKRYIGAC